MRRLLSLLAAVALTTGICASARADGTSGFTHLTQIGRLRAPVHGFLLDLPPATQIAPGQLQVFENGARISAFTLSPIQAVEGRFGVVLAVDASESMRGAAAQAALDAAVASFLRGFELALFLAGVILAAAGVVGFRGLRHLQSAASRQRQMTDVSMSK